MLSNTRDRVYNDETTPDAINADAVSDPSCVVPGKASPMISDPCPTPLEKLHDSEGTVYTYVSRWDYEGRWMLCYRWFDPREPDEPQIYEVEPYERAALIASGWWKAVTA